MPSAKSSKVAKKSSVVVEGFETEEDRPPQKRVSLVIAVLIQWLFAFLCVVLGIIFSHFHVATPLALMTASFVLGHSAMIGSAAYGGESTTLTRAYSGIQVLVCVASFLIDCVLITMIILYAQYDTEKCIKHSKWFFGNGTATCADEFMQMTLGALGFYTVLFLVHWALLVVSLSHSSYLADMEHYEANKLFEECKKVEKARKEARDRKAKRKGKVNTLRAEKVIEPMAVKQTKDECQPPCQHIIGTHAILSTSQSDSADSCLCDCPSDEICTDENCIALYGEQPQY